MSTLGSISENDLDGIDNQDDATNMGDQKPECNESKNKLQMVL